MRIPRCQRTRAGKQCEEPGEFFVSCQSDGRDGKYTCGKHLAATVRDVIGDRVKHGSDARIQWAGEK